MDTAFIPGAVGRGQSSVELVFCVGFFLCALSAVMSGVYPEWDAAQRVSMAVASAGDIRGAVDRVYGAGAGSKETITVNVPSGVVATQAADNRLLIRLQVAGGLSDVLEVTSAPVTGYIPSREGVHKLPVEYKGGFVVVGGGLSLQPSYMELNVPAGNASALVFTVSNNGGRNLSRVNLSVSGAWFALNESAFPLGSGSVKAVWAEVKVPPLTVPASYPHYVVVEGDGDYAESMVTVVVEGVVCGDTVKDVSEECDTRTPFTFPDGDNPNCPNPSSGQLTCDLAGLRYLAYDQYGSCSEGCNCVQDSPSWLWCGAGCVDVRYCAGCDHCSDNATNCGETSVDAGGACPACDGVGDLAEGFPCALGESRQCGVGGCVGTQTCVLDGSSCAWSPCTSSGLKCQGLKCCACGGSASNPSPAYDSSAHGDCTPSYDRVDCGDPESCSGGFYRGECVGLDLCAPDWDGSTWPVEASSSACAGVECAPADSVCYDQDYPCHGRRTAHMCSSGGACVSSVSEDDGACSGCYVPRSVIVHKLDVNVFDDYVDANASHWGWAGGYPLKGPDYTCIHGCPSPDSGKSPIAEYTFRDVYYSEPGAYYPFRNGRLYVYGKASQLDGYCYWRTNRYTDCLEDCMWGYCGGNKIRIGNNDTSYFEYPGPEWINAGWQRAAIDLGTPSLIVGSPDWNGSIGFLEFVYVASSRCPSQYKPCYVSQDIVTVER